MGRPAFKLTKDLLVKAEAMAAQGLTMDQIASVLHIAPGTLYAKKKEYKELDEAIKRGKDKGIATIANALFQKAKSGDTTSMIFFLKCRANWKETQKHELTGEDGEPLKVETIVRKVVKS